MPYMMAGYPDRDTGLAVAAAYVDAGADLIELGVPFSDPLADGPTIHAAATEALEAGATLATALEVCRAVGERVPGVRHIYLRSVVLQKDRRYVVPGAEAELFRAELKFFQALQEDDIGRLAAQLFPAHLVRVAGWRIAVAGEPAATRRLRGQEQIVVSSCDE